MSIKIILDETETELILDLINSEIDDCEKENNYGGNYGENLLFLRNKMNERSKAQTEKEKANLIEELGYDPNRDDMQDHWDHESDKISIMQEFHDNEML